MNDWFTIERLEADTFCISEYRHWEETHCYLLLGQHTALLLDTGLGIGNLRAQVETLTDLPILVATTHAHWDHIGGHGQFERHGIHPLERQWLSGNFPLPLSTVRSMLSRDCLLPKDFCLDAYTIFHGVPTLLLNEGTVLDLGGRQITALHTPGHSPGHLCFWEDARGNLFTGDLVYQGTLYAHYPSTDPQAFLHSLERIAALPARRVFPGHHQLDISPNLPTAMVHALQSLQQQGKLRHGSGLHTYDNWAIQL